VELRPLDPHDTAAAALLAQSDAYMAALYPAESNHMESAASLTQPHVLFLGAWLDGTLAGCGAAKRMRDEAGDYGEIKRVFVPPAFRGHGIARALMSGLEAHLREHGIALARLETGVSQPEALGLYRALGYVIRGPFGAYPPDPYSVFMEKRLAAHAGSRTERC
jgi:putative acetyltransferase